MIKEREYCMSVDNFKRPLVYKNQQAIAVLLTRLILLNPGSDPLHPDMGVEIKVTEDKLCNIEITIDDVMYVYDSSEAPIPITLDSAR